MFTAHGFGIPSIRVTMYAIIRRYELNSGSGDHLGTTGDRFGAALSRVRGFIAAVTVDETGVDKTPFTIALFEDHASLIVAEGIAQQWLATQQEAEVLSTAEVVAQRGL